MRARRPGTSAVLVAAIVAPLASVALIGAPAGAAVSPAAKKPVAIGTGGAVASVDLAASEAGLRILKAGGNAVDAAVATAAALGVTEPYSGGIGGGGFFVFYDARAGRVLTINGRESAPARFHRRSFIDPSTGDPIPFVEAVTSGLSVGVPGTVRQWTEALRRFGTMRLSRVLEPAISIAEQGFVVDSTFRLQTLGNRDRFADFPPTRRLFLTRTGDAPRVGSVFRNPDLARTYRQLGARGSDFFYTGALAREIVQTVQSPPVRPGAPRRVRPGVMTIHDLQRYAAPVERPTHLRYRGLDVYGAPPPSSGGTTVGEALNILERFALSRVSRAQALHYYLEASRLAFADRGRYVGDPAYVPVPVRELLADGFARERACLIRRHEALESPVDPGSPDGNYRRCQPGGADAATRDTEGMNTTHLTVADRWGNIAAYTFTIEQTGGSGIVVPGRGFLLNNELTDFSFGPPVPGGHDPNLPAPGKRPRSSISPTIVLDRGTPVLAVGSPGGSTIITTVLQVLVNHLDRGMSLPEAIAAPRVSQRNSDPASAEPEFLALPVADVLQDRYGQEMAVVTPSPLTPPQYFLPEIGAATGIRFFRGGVLQAVAEPRRRGGGSALVVNPRG